MKKVEKNLWLTLKVSSGNAILSIAAITLIMASLFACEQKAETINEEDANQTFLTKLQSVPFLEVSKVNLPKWLLSKIELIESDLPSISGAKIYRGEWQKQVVYFIRNHFYSCILCYFYYEDGREIIKKPDNFYIQSKNWIVIYKYGEFELDRL